MQRGLYFVVFALAVIFPLAMSLENPILTESAEGGVIRRIAHAGGWSRLGPGDSLNWGDTISTGERGEAVININRKVRIRLRPATVLHLAQRDGQTHLSFLSGRAEIAANPSDRKKLLVTHALGKGTDWVRVAGELSMEPENQHVLWNNPIDLVSPRDRSAPLDTKGRLLSAISSLQPPLLKSPPDRAVIDLTEKREERLQWEIRERPEGVARFEVTLLPLVSGREAITISARETELSISQIFRAGGRAQGRRLTPGHYLWAVRTLGRDGDVSPRSQERRIEIRDEAQISKPRLLPIRVK